jgi:hypothetical protein
MSAAGQSHVYYIKYKVRGIKQWQTFRREDGSCTFLSAHTASLSFLAKFGGEPMPNFDICQFPPAGCALRYAPRKGG